MHAFCEKCINEWMKKDNACPMCRQTILTQRYTQITKDDKDLNNSFFELIDIDGKDNVISDLEL